MCDRPFLGQETAEMEVENVTIQNGINKANTRPQKKNKKSSRKSQYVSCLITLVCIMCQILGIMHENQIFYSIFSKEFKNCILKVKNSFWKC